MVESGHVGTLIVIGGDTAAALLGDALVVVHGSVRPGTALVESLVVDVPVITRAGGFGAIDALSELLWEHGVVTGAPFAITMGDASGVGPEIVLRVPPTAPCSTARWWCTATRRSCAHGADLLGLDVADRVIAHPSDAAPGRARGRRCRAARRRPTTVPAGSTRRRVRQPARTSRRPPMPPLAGDVAAIVTMPMNKEATQLTDPQFVGHTEFIAERCGARSVTMMLTADHAERVARRHAREHALLAARGDRAGAGTIACVDVIGLTARGAAPHSSRHRGSRCAGSTRTRGSTGCSAARTPSTSLPRSPRPSQRASRPAGRTRPTPCSSRRCTGTATTRSS